MIYYLITNNPLKSRVTLITNMDTPQISNWQQLLEAINEKINTLADNTKLSVVDANDGTDLLANNVFNKLLTKINNHLKPHQKQNENFDYTIVSKNQLDTFNNFKLTYNQLIIETDATDIFVEIPSLTTTNLLSLNITNTGKWIKIYPGNPEKIFFFDDEKTMLSDKTIADFIHKLQIIGDEYRFFGEKPIVYYKFAKLPNADVVEYMQNFGVRVIVFNQKTDELQYSKHNDTVFMDQTMLLTWCSNLSYGLSQSFYKFCKEQKTAQIMVSNKQSLDNYLMDKKIITNQTTYNQISAKIKLMGGEAENARLQELERKLQIVDDTQNNRFYYLKDYEILYASAAEAHGATIITGNCRFINKLRSHYPEIDCKLFSTAQLAEAKYV